mmetsp:Transcript_22458/g.42618  ORF Transcript_22458/g.42618 Transcript_22458/m.42618 type:complete len:124 (+) Transcript_22458:506-877(+)
MMGNRMKDRGLWGLESGVEYDDEIRLSLYSFSQSDEAPGDNGSQCGVLTRLADEGVVVQKLALWPGKKMGLDGSSCRLYVCEIAVRKFLHTPRSWSMRTQVTAAISCALIFQQGIGPGTSHTL